jgi:hypothetical protein
VTALDIRGLPRAFREIMETIDEDGYPRDVPLGDRDPSNETFDCDRRWNGLPMETENMRRQEVSERED